MSIPPEFFIPHHTCDIDDPSKRNENQYFIDTICEFDVPSHQQLDDLTRLFDQLHREKSPTAIFSKQELFIPLYSYMKGITSKDSLEVVTKVARHKMCHEVSEKMKKLLQVCAIYLRKKMEGDQTQETLQVCLRSTLKMYCFVICTILAAVVPKNDDASEESSQRSGGRRKRRRDTDSGFGDDDSGVDLDGRELALSSLIEMFSVENISLWPNSMVESTTLNLVFRMSLHMVTQKSNISGDAQCISSALSLLLARVLNWMSSLNTVDVSDLTYPLVDVSLKSESAVNFLCKLVSDIEAEESGSATSQAILSGIFESMANAALHDAVNDSSAAKNISIFFSEVSKRSVSVTQKYSNLIRTILQSENHDIRKGAITSMSELVIQKYSGVTHGSSEDTERTKYLNEILFRVMDVNLFVRNHTLHIWDKLIESKAVPRAFYVLVAEAIVGRLEDKSYLVRGSAMSCISNLMKKIWFGQVLNTSMLDGKYREAIASSEGLFSPDMPFKDAFEVFKFQRAPQFEAGLLVDGREDAVDDIEEEKIVFEPEQVAVLSKAHFYECAKKFVLLMKKAVYHAVLLLDSKTERDVVEAIQLIVTAADCRLDDCEAACLKMVVLVFHTESKIQGAVRDAFADIVFSSFNNRVAVPQLTRITASAQKLIHLLRDAREGEISAVERIFGLMKLSPTLSRHISNPFLEAIWSIVEESVDSTATVEERRIAMRIYSILSKFVYKNVRDRKDRIIEFLQSDVPKDNMIVSYVFKTLENEAFDPHYKPISTTENPLSTPILSEIIFHLCRPTTALSSWMCLASAGINAIHSLCEVPVLVYGYILNYLERNISRDENSRAQLCFLVGCTALKQLVAVEMTERKQMKVLEETSQSASSDSAAQTDSMQKDLGLGSMEFRRHAIQDLSQKRKKAILDDNSMWAGLAKIVVNTVKETTSEKESLERVCAVIALCQLMICSETFCSDQLPFLFDIVSQRHEHWVVKTNVVIALGDLACVHPNILAPFLSHPTSGLFKLLKDDDLRVRSVTIQVCSHLVLGEMLRIKDHLFTIVKLVADPDSTIAENAVTFIQNLALKEKERIGNLIPPLVTKLSGMPQDKFRVAMRTLLEKVEGDKPTESLIDRLCQRFESFHERSKKKLILAENIAFCLSELNYNSDRVLKKLLSEPCYQQYRLWLRKSSVLDFFKLIASKAKKVNRFGSGTRDLSTLEEWENRMLLDAAATS